MISIIICSIDPAKFENMKAQFSELLGDEPYEIIGVHDAKGLCEGYNRAIPHALGEYFIFCHDDIEILTPDFRQKLKRHLKSFDVVGVAGADRIIGGLWSLAGPPYIHGQIAHPAPEGIQYDVQIFSQPAPVVSGIQALDGLFIACRASVVETISWDEKTFDGWHGYDVDFTFAAHLAGFGLAVACDIAMIHHSIGNPDKVWEHYVNTFNRKYLRHLFPMPRREFVTATVRVNTKQEVLEVMSPRYWLADQTEAT